MRRILLAAALLVACSGEDVLGPDQLQFTVSDIPAPDSLPVIDASASAGTVVVTGALPVDRCAATIDAEGVRTSSSLTLTITATAKTPEACPPVVRATSFQAQLGDVDPGTFQVLVYWDAADAPIRLAGSKTVQVP